ncbi:unnamed protein product [Darwinula stevensoni]|uniref:Transmembrane protein n=1 Tax=Darwinula stevensoni TaxID=69355 RepID=A0A7R9FS01_9CRUS|nr:unnamed protein product [Darwinula stevensoni]CAG0901922.1 unnamed protein product [Darwinula stevensoni]
MVKPGTQLLHVSLLVFFASLMFIVVGVGSIFFAGHDGKSMSPALKFGIFMTVFGGVGFLTACAFFLFRICILKRGLSSTQMSRRLSDTSGVTIASGDEVDFDDGEVVTVDWTTAVAPDPPPSYEDVMKRERGRPSPSPSPPPVPSDTGPVFTIHSWVHPQHGDTDTGKREEDFQHVNMEANFSPDSNAYAYQPL